MSSVQETKAVIRRGIHANQQAQRLLDAIYPLFADANDLARYTTYGSEQQRVKDGRFLLTQAKTAMGDVEERLSNALDEANEYLDRLG